MPKPIFLVGWRRSGTTWLGTLISQNTNVASIMGGAPGKKGGCVESFYVSHLAGKFGDLKNYNNLIYFIEVFGSSTYYILSGLDKEFLYRKRPLTYEELFKVVMDQYAEMNDADFWFEKNPSHSFHIEEISGYYQDAKFIAITRDIVDQVRSALKMNKLERIEAKGLKKALNILKEIIGYYMSCKHISHFKAKYPERILVVSYEELVKTRETELITICKFLGLEFQPAMLESPYKAGSSFKSEKDREKELSPVQIRIIKMISPFFALLPYSFYHYLYLIAKRIQGIHFPYWFFSTQIERYGWDDISDPDRTGDLSANPDD